MKTASFFAGVGGIDLAFKQKGFINSWGNEIDKYASETYRANFNNHFVTGDIKEISPVTIPNFNIMLAGFPCQAFSLAGYRKGFDDDRGNLFFELVRILEDKKPEIIFLENVKNLVGHDRGKTFVVILNILEKNGYTVKHRVLNACEYGNIPQNRERIYIIAFKSKDFANKFIFPNPIPLTASLSEFIDFNTKQDEKYYYTEKSCSFFKELKQNVIRKDTLYQWRRVYVRENKSNLCPTLTANMGTGGHNVPIILTKYGIRKLTPRECFNLQGFPSDFILPKHLSNTRLYKQAGNSVVVPVINRIAKEIKKVISNTE